MAAFRSRSVTRTAEPARFGPLSISTLKGDFTFGRSGLCLDRPYSASRTDIGPGWRHSVESVTHSDVEIQQLDKGRFAFTVNGLVRYVGSQVECVRRAALRSRTT